MTVDLARLRAAYENVRDELLAERTPDGHWEGELSSSALSTATAVSALSVFRTAFQSPKSKVQSQLSETLDLGPWTLDSLIARGVAYLARQQNDDGGFGDTDLSHSNIATTYLVVAALHLAGVADEHDQLLARANAYIDSKDGLEGLRKRYGIDKTFVVPIMTNLALAGLLDWNQIDPLPFELACVPQSWYRFVGMPVVSYAIPALVAIGQARFHHAMPRNPITRLTRWLSIARSLKVLRRMQPDSGGYLEATPLTAFVVMSLASTVQASGGRQPPGNVDRDGSLPGASRLPLADTLSADVIGNGVRFLANSIRPDGSWPIDTNLATWNTTLAINALAGAEEDVAKLLDVDDETLRQTSRAFVKENATLELRKLKGALPWLISCQHFRQHAFTGASPGGFGWSDLSGAVPDADDTPGAILAFGAIVKLDMRVPFVRDLIGNSLFFYALGWLVALQNRDGGWPTFCRGWGKLPFDRSGTDLTAHALRAISITARRLSEEGSERQAQGYERLLSRIAPRAMAFIRRRQHPDGSWSPLWFGNQDHPDEDNPVYGTAKVLFAYRDLGLMDSPEAQRGVAWLVANQNADGGWGSGVWEKARARRELQIGNWKLQIANCDQSLPHSIPNLQFAINNSQSSVEETALAVEALLAALPQDGTVSADSRNATEGVPYRKENPNQPHSLNPEPRVLSGCPNPGPALNPASPSPQPPALALARGLAWLIDRVEAGQHRQPAPIGFYFAKLWYYERLYPLTFTVAALGRAYRQFARHAQPDSDPVPIGQPRSVPSDIRAP